MENTDSSYQSRLSKIRQMPQSLSSESTSKRESTRDLRIETYLAWADLAWTLSYEINLHPETGLNVLMKTVRREKDKLPHPDLAEKFLFELDVKKSVTQDSLRKLKRSLGIKVPRGKFQNPLDWDEDESKKVGIQLFKLITGELPMGNISIIDTSLAVGVLVDSDEDLMKLRQKEMNIGGFYRSWQPVYLEFKRIAFPLIVVKQSNYRGGTVRHEQEHAVNNAIIHTLEYDRDEMGNRWGGRGYFFKDVEINNVQDLIDVMQQEILPYALSHAKDEILAGYLDSRDFTYIEALLDRDSVYNYFQDITSVLKENGAIRFGDKEIDKVEDMFWENYKSILEKNIEICKNTLNLYREYGFQKREALLPFVLAQIPLSEWEKVIGQDFYLEVKNFWSGQMRLKSSIVRAAWRKDGGFKKEAYAKSAVAKAAFKALWSHGVSRKNEILKFASNNQLVSLYRATPMFDEEVEYQREQSKQIFQDVVVPQSD